jgi:hypothetical protein
MERDSICPRFSYLHLNPALCTTCKPSQNMYFLLSNPPSVLSVPLCRFYQPVNQFLNQPIPLTNLLIPHVNRLLELLTIPISSHLPEKLSLSWS